MEHATFSFCQQCHMFSTRLNGNKHMVLYYFLALCRPFNFLFILNHTNETYTSIMAGDPPVIADTHTRRHTQAPHTRDIRARQAPKTRSLNF